MKWMNVQVCAGCWIEANPSRVPVRVKDANTEACAACGLPTSSGIYVRMEFPTEEPQRTQVELGPDVDLGDPVVIHHAILQHELDMMIDDEER
jgi:hypothetical protein